jgi:hypothetical protein
MLIANVDFKEPIAMKEQTTEQAIGAVVEIIRADGVLLAPSGLGTFALSVGRHYTATERPAYSFWWNNRSRVYKSPRHAAQAFVSGAGYKNTQEAIARYREDK